MELCCDDDDNIKSKEVIPNSPSAPGGPHSTTVMDTFIFYHFVRGNIFVSLTRKPKAKFLAKTLDNCLRFCTHFIFIEFTTRPNFQTSLKFMLFTKQNIYY